MGQIVVSEFITLDGVAEDPGGAEDLAGGGWSFQFDRAKEGDRFKYDELFASDAHLVSGSIGLVRSLLAADLVDELRLMVFPIILGTGKRLFGDNSDPAALRLVSSRLAGETVILTFQRRHDATQAPSRAEQLTRLGASDTDT